LLLRSIYWNVNILTENIELLRYAFRKTKRPFNIDSIVILPEHLHCILTLPIGDNDFSGRWRMINIFKTTT